jgi:hypothetical protein
VFYRPLITLSFAIDAAFFGAHPFGAHLQNTLVHALNTLLVFLLATRFLGRRTGGVLALLWTVSPSNTAAVQWAVGRVDTHSAFWYLLGLLLCARRDRRQQGRALLPWVFGCGLLTKEMLITFPAAAFLVALASAPGDWRQRTRAAAAWTAPLCWVLLAYFVLRRVTLGEWVGGYVDSPLRAGGAGPLWNLVADGWQVLVDLAVPWSTAHAPTALTGNAWLGAGAAAFLLPCGLGLARLGWRRVLFCDPC